VSCSRCSSAIFSLRPRSITDSTRLVTSRPGVLPVPEKPITATHMVSGSDQERHARTRRAVPMRLDAMPSKGTATCAGVTPAPPAARRSQPRNEGGNASTGKSGRSPRRSSRSVQSGSSQVPVSAFRPLACCSSLVPCLALRMPERPERSERSESGVPSPTDEGLSRSRRSGWGSFLPASIPLSMVFVVAR